MIKNYFDEEYALSELLKAGVLFCNEREFITHNEKTNIEGPTVVLFVNCNDCFVPAADALNLPLSKLKSLYDLWRQYGDAGVLKWCCFQYNEKPRKSMIEWIKEKGAWDEQLEKLPDNKFDAAMAKL